MIMHKVLVIDDEPDIRELLSMTLLRMGLDCDTVERYREAIEHIDKEEYSMVLTDMRLPDGDGIDIVKYIQKKKPQLPVAVITAYGNIEGAVNSLKSGAFDYVSKPVDLKILKELVKSATHMHLIDIEADEEDLLVGKSVEMNQLRESISKVARSQAPVFIYGDSGVGKEVVARLIHAKGPRKDKSFVPVNCGAIPMELMESEFFGHKKGSFTGAISDKTGLFEAANGGTLFLDEIAELPITMQVKLLRAIQEKAIKPIGALHETSVDVRILSASHKNLLDEIKSGTFRQDLFYRVNVIEIRVPALSERMKDIPDLVGIILKKLAKKLNQPVAKIQPACFSLMNKYHFPGNVRELENILERALAMSEGGIIRPSDLHFPQDIVGYKEAETADLASLPNFLEEQEKEKILDALEKTKWNRTAAARLLGVSFRTLRYRLKKLGLD